MELFAETETEVQETKPEVLKKENSTLVEKAKGITIANEKDKLFAAAFLVELKTGVKKVIDFFEDSKKKASEAHKAICANEKAMTSPLENAITVIDGKIKAYVREMNRIQTEAQQKAAEDAEKLRKQAAKAIRKGDNETGESLQVQAAMTVAEVTYVPEKMEGVSMRHSWTWELVDLSQVPREYLTVNTALLDAMVKSQKASATSKPEDFLHKIPGIKITVKSSLAVRANK